MRFWSVAPLAAAAFATVGASGGPAFADQNLRVSAPLVHDNLAVYFVHGTSAGGPVPLTLQEALARGRVQVIETGRVNELQIENTGAEEVFIQAGDIVKGGKQDRVLTVSFLLAPNSGRVPIASFCVEQGRWSARGREDVSKFTSALEAMPSRSALMVMAAPPPAQPSAEARPAGQPDARQGVAGQRAGDTADKQRKVWDSVSKAQRDLSAGVGARVAAPESSTSLQLTLENEKLKEARAAYVKAFEDLGLKESDVVGFIVAINGKVASANIYPSNGLYRKMWSKQLAAVVTEAIGEKTAAGAAPAEPPPAPKAMEFLAEAEKGRAQEREIAGKLRQETRDSDGALYSESRRDGKAYHKSYLAK